MAEQRVRIAIVGCGDISHKRYFPGMDECRERAELVAVCDSRREIAQREADDFSAKGDDAPLIFEDCAVMLREQELDGVFVATPHQVHAENVIACAEAGVHVHTEKPMAATYAEALSMVGAVERDGVHFFPLPFDYSPGYEAARALIHDGAIGAVHAAMVVSGHSGPGHAAWFYKKESLGGAIIDMGVYGISQVLGIMGPVHRLQAFSGIRKPDRVTDDAPDGVKPEVEDHAMIVADWGDGVYGSINCSWVLPPDMKRSGAGIRITGDKGVCYIAWPGDSVTVVPADDADIPDGAEVLETGAGKGYRPDTSGFPEKDIVTHFIDVIAGRDACVGNGRQQAHVVELMTAAYESAESGKAVELSGCFDGYARRSQAARMPVHTKPATGRDSDAG